MKTIMTRDEFTGASCKLQLIPWQGGQMMRIWHNGSMIERLASGARLEAAIAAFTARDVDTFGELMFPSRIEAREAA